MADQRPAAHGVKAPGSPEHVFHCDVPAAIPKVSTGSRAATRAQEPESIEELVKIPSPQTPEARVGKSLRSGEVSTPPKAPKTPRTPRNIRAKPGGKTPATNRTATTSVQGSQSPSSPSTYIMAKRSAPRPKKRHLVRWSDALNNKLLLSIQSACNAEGVSLPWDRVGALMGEHVTGGAVIQHLAKLRSRMVKGNESVPPPLRRGNAGSGSARPSGGSGPNTPKTPKKGRNAASPRSVRKRAEKFSDEDDIGDVEYDDDSDSEYGKPPLKRSKTDTGRSRKAKTDIDCQEGAAIEKDSEDVDAEQDEAFDTDHGEDPDAEHDEDGDPPTTTDAGGWVAGGASFTRLVDDDESSVDETIKREDVSETEEPNSQQSKLVTFRLQPQNLLTLQRANANTETLFEPSTFTFANSGALAVESVGHQRISGMISANQNPIALGQNLAVGLLNQPVAISTQPNPIRPHGAFAYSNDSVVTPHYQGHPPIPSSNFNGNERDLIVAPHYQGFPAMLCSNCNGNEHATSNFASFNSNVSATSNFDNSNDSAISNTMMIMSNLNNSAASNVMNSMSNPNNVAGQYNTTTALRNIINSPNLTSFNTMNNFNMNGISNLNMDSFNGANNTNTGSSPLTRAGLISAPSTVHIPSTFQGSFGNFHGVLGNQMVTDTFQDQNWAMGNVALLENPWQDLGAASTLNPVTQQPSEPTIVETSDPTMTTLNTPVNKDNAVINRLTEIEDSNEAASFSQALDDMTRFAGSQFE